jgi:exodeoxyribonuclease VII large subunit
MSRGPLPPDPLLPPWDELPGDPVDDAAPRRVPVPGGTFGVRIRSVSEVARALRDHVRSDEGLRDLWVEGEIGRVTVSTAGHAYFSLKDARSQLQCVWFRDDRVRSPFQAQAGLQVLVHGRMDLFEPQGALQLYVEAIQPSGVGNLALRFEETKARLAAEGLFDAARKRRLPPRPRTVALVTSPTGAVWRDVCNVLARRWPLVRVVLVPCQVQGDAAPASIVAALRRLEGHVAAEVAAGRGTDAPAVTILARGGGSLEDLWAFNDERVVRAIAAHPVPVVAGIGHEVDVTLADFVADVRAPTPSAAAELVVPDLAEAVAALRAAGRRAGVAASRVVGITRRDLDAERRALVGVRPEAQLAASRERVGLLLDRAARVVDARIGGDARRLEALAGRPARAVVERLAAAASGLAAASASLAALGPEATLRRGYAIVRRVADGRILRDPGDAPAGERLVLALAGGTLAARSEGPTGEGSGAA